MTNRFIIFALSSSLGISCCRLAAASEDTRIGVEEQAVEKMTASNHPIGAVSPKSVLAASLVPTLVGIGGFLVFGSGLLTSSEYVTALGGTIATVNLVGGPSIGQFMIGRIRRGTITTIARALFAVLPVVANALLWAEYNEEHPQSQDEDEDDDGSMADMGEGVGVIGKVFFYAMNLGGMGGMIGLGLADVRNSHRYATQYASGDRAAVWYLFPSVSRSDSGLLVPCVTIGASF